MYTVSESNLDRLLVLLKTMGDKLKSAPEPMRTMLLASPDVKSLIEATAALENEIRRVPTQTPVQWSASSGKIQCIWQGTHSRCIYEHGHYGQHKEATSATE